MPPPPNELAHLPGPHPGATNPQQRHMRPRSGAADGLARPLFGASLLHPPQLPPHFSILISCSCPSLLTSFREGLVPRARTWTCAGFDSPTKLITDPSSVAAILTLGAPLESISRSSTVSGYPVVPSGIL